MKYYGKKIEIFIASIITYFCFSDNDNESTFIIRHGSEFTMIYAH